MKRNESFNSAAKLYDEVRPSYPKKVIDWIINETQITLDGNLLEIAPGTGQATMRFAERGYKIHAVELGDQLAKILFKNTKDYDVTVDVSPFEKWESNNQYKMIYCATAFHWLDPNIRYKKCHQLLEDDGHLVLIWNSAAVGSNNSIIDQAYEILFEYYPDKKYESNTEKLNLIRNKNEEIFKDFQETGFFTYKNYFEMDWVIKQSKILTIKSFYSQSSYLSLDSHNKQEVTKRLNALFDDLEDIVSETLTTRVIIAKKAQTAL